MMFASQVIQFNELKGRYGAISEALKPMQRFGANWKDRDGNRLRSVGPVDNRHFTFLEAVNYATGTVRAFSNLKLSSSAPVPTPLWDAILAGTGDFERAVRELGAAVTSVMSDSRPLRAVSGSRLATDPGDQVVFDITGGIHNLVTYSDSLATNISNIAAIVSLSAAGRAEPDQPLVRDDAASALSALEQAEAAKKAAEDAAAEASRLLAEIASKSSDLEGVLNNARDSASDSLSKLEAAKTTIAQESGEIISAVAVSSSKVDELTRLESQGKELHQSLVAFSATIEETKKRIEGAATSAAEIQKEYEEQHTAIAEMLLKADRMVGGATVAGLAQAFGDEKQELRDSMRNMLWQFYVGIFFLFLSSLMLVLYVIGYPLPVPAGHPQVPVAQVTIQGLVARSIVILAPFWMTMFAARRYRDLFNLKQRYSHKYNMAFSMNGFKTQAPGLAEQIAAWVFTIVADNPVDGSSAKKTDPEGDEKPPLTVAELCASFGEQVIKRFSRAGA